MILEVFSNLNDSMILWFYGLVVDLAVLGEWLDLMILKVFSDLNDSMIL